MNEKLKKIHARALSEYDESISACKDERHQCLDDRRFVYIKGAQWEGNLSQQFENKPKLEVNKLWLAVKRLYSEYRNNRITVDFKSKEGSEYDKLSDTCDGLYRADELDSVAEEAYDNAFEEGVAGGMGAYRFRAVYEDEEDEEDERQRIIIEPLFDTDNSVFFNAGAKRYDKSDATSCHVITSMTPDEFKEAFDEDPASWDKDIYSSQFDWFTGDLVYVSEYYKVETETQTIQIWADIAGKEKRYDEADFVDDEDLETRLTAIGSKMVRTRKIQRKRVRKYILSGGGVLEDCGYIAGNRIPIAPFYATRCYIDGKERIAGHIRMAVDSQRTKNVVASKLMEISALSSVEKPILTPEQIAGNEIMWAEDNIKDYNYLLLNKVTDEEGRAMPAGALGYTRAPQIPPALVALLQTCEQDLEMLLGNQQAGEQIRSNIAEGTVSMIQSRLDMQVYIYMSNFAKTMKCGGEIWLGMARDLYIEQKRKMKTITKDGKSKTIELGEQYMDEDGNLQSDTDLSKAKFDIVATVGASSDSKRSATVKSLINMSGVTQDPETQQVLSSLIMMNMEGEGLSDSRDFFRRKLIQMGAVKPTDEEAKELAQAAQNQQPDANTVYLQAAAKEADSKAKKLDAETYETLVDVEKTKAETQTILSELDMAKLDKLKAMWT